MPIERKLAAIMFTDIVGFTKIMGDDESTALSILENQQSLISTVVEEHKGTIIKKMGDGLLIEFPSTVESVECATQMQDSIKSYNTSDDNLEFHIRIGIHLGDIVILGDDILGDGVNIASRIEPLASPDGICITDAVYQSVKSKLKLDAKRIDEVDLKHIDDKYTIYKIPEKDIEKNVEHISAPAEKSDKIKILSQTYFPSFIRCSIIESKKYIPFYILFAILFAIDGLPTHRDLLIIISFIVLPIVYHTLISARRTLKLTFDDIRDIPKILDIFIISLGYQIDSKNNKSRVYTPFWKWEPKIITKLKSVPILRKLIDVNLILELDGNTIKLTAINMHLIRLSNSLKRYVN